MVFRFNEKYSKDLVATKKKLGEAQTRITVLEKQVSTVFLLLQC